MDEPQIEIPEKFKSLIETIEKMSILDLSELVKVLEKKFGVSATMPMTTPAVAAPEPSAGEVQSAPSTVSVHLMNVGGQKIQVIKALREAFGLGLKEAKDMTDTAPKVIKEAIKREEAEELKKQLEAVGATIEIK